VFGHMVPRGTIGTGAIALGVRADGTPSNLDTATKLGGRSCSGEWYPHRVSARTHAAAGRALVDSESCPRVVGTPTFGPLAPPDSGRWHPPCSGNWHPPKPIAFPYRFSAIFFRLLQARACGFVDSRPRGRPGSSRGQCAQEARTGFAFAHSHYPLPTNPQAQQ
jgi:hypothetical protein